MFVLAAAGVATADSLNCRLVGTYDAPEGAIDLAVFDSLVYIADWGSGLRIVTNEGNK